VTGNSGRKVLTTRAQSLTRRAWMRTAGPSAMAAAFHSKVAAFASLAVSAETPESRALADHARSEQIDSILTSAGLEPGSIPGAAALVVEGHRTIYQRGFGITDLDSPHKIDAHTNFRLASVTKQFTAMAIMLLVGDGKLRYHSRLTEIFSDFPDYGRAITIRNLLNHTSGLEDYEDLMPEPDPGLPIERIQIHDEGVLALLKKQKTTKFPPGSKWAYSNSGYVVLGLVVQRISGQPFPDFLRDRIFTPLGMTGTVAYVRGKNQVTHRAFGHTLENGTWKQTDQSPTSATLGDGGVYSSLADLRKWDRAIATNRLLSARDMEPALVPVKVPNGEVTEPGGTPAAYGFGWFLNPYKGHRRMWHYGETIGFRSTSQRFVDDNLTIVILCNRADLVPQALALRMADLYWIG
jgi:CubicO group peptidase (beta-lactamase class C family)